MGVTDASADEGGGPDLRVSSKGLTKLAGDLGDMQDHLDKQVKRMDAIVDRIEAGWRGPAGTAYREFHRAATEDAVRIREVMKLLEGAVRLSRDGFSEHDLEVLEQMQRIQVDINSEVGKLSTPNPEIGTGGAPSPPRSSLDSF
ncbi:MULTISPECIES: WXG100 family type VII secretion target [Streptomyces]|jgi:WXG100 family type VII secretion target|uniref:WXG100 family type VII secretion target n=2 Tax=Streptomyces mirabilis TaxID=68239 RepID=A0A1I2TJ53_9ACTN|nr:WXG100 family type VII secretion target [Streptomyces mirabilis]MCX4611404.1 WXG100 family type VII secretion target [Streptomyces mirabilis]SFG62526.1 WXG100 family type VII secretion target [Streptomyces mirabilis]